jgi:hypothetical protein
MDNESQRRVKALRDLHEQSCFEAGVLPDEVDTPFSAGADAIERLDALEASGVLKRSEPSPEI